MLYQINQLVRKASQLVVPETFRNMVDDIQLNEVDQSGFDRFGAHKDGVAFAVALNSFLYEKYFRVKSYGAENIPASGATIFTPNHGGTIPLDGMMIHQDVIRHTSPSRLVRPIADYFVPRMPIISSLFARAGVVSGARGNVDYLLRKGEAIMVFPEGLPGISKTYANRYHVQKWRKGHIELALKHRAAIIPVAVVGPDDQMPLLAKLESLQVLGAPYIPITLTPLPMPVRYHIYYGEPVYPHKELSKRGQFRDVKDLATHLRGLVQVMIDRGLEDRKGVFR